MGNFLSFASVTATISYILEEVNRDISGIKITAKPLDAIDLQSPVNALNIFLYYVTPYSAIDSIDTLVKDQRGNVTNNPVLALDLHYLLTATSSENDDLVSQKILASAMRILNEHPVLSRELIRKAIRNNEGLESSDLADQVEDVKFSLNALAPDDLSKIWSRFPSTNFRPSVGYTANIVLLESKLIEPPGPMRGFIASPVGQLKTPRIDRIDPVNVEYAEDATIVIIGDNLRGLGTSVAFNDLIIAEPAKPEDVSENRIIVNIPAVLEPGIIKVNVNHYLNAAGTSEPNSGAKSVTKSNVSPFVLAPRIVSPRQGKVKRDTDLVIDFVPCISADKRISVLLGDVVFTAIPVKTSTSQPEAKVNRIKIMVPISIANGPHLLRISVDGADSRLVTDQNPRSPTFKKAIEPVIEIVS